MGLKLSFYTRREFANYIVTVKSIKLYYIIMCKLFINLYIEVDLLLYNLTKFIVQKYKFMNCGDNFYYLFRLSLYYNSLYL